MNFYVIVYFDGHNCISYTFDSLNTICRQQALSHQQADSCSSTRHLPATNSNNQEQRGNGAIFSSAAREQEQEESSRAWEEQRRPRASDTQSYARV
jgi:hypothetical protein